MQGGRHQSTEPLPGEKVIQVTYHPKHDKGIQADEEDMAYEDLPQHPPVEEESSDDDADVNTAKL